MKMLLTAIFTLCVVSSKAGEIQIVPAHPPLAEVKKLVEDAAIILVCKPNATKDNLEVLKVIKGDEHYGIIKDQISDYLGESDKKALATKDYRELVFISAWGDRKDYRTTSTLALWPQYDDVLANGQRIRFLSHSTKDIEGIVREQQEKPHNQLPD